MGLTRAFFCPFTTKNISVVEKPIEGFLSHGVLLGSGLWHNTAPDLCGALTQAVEGRLACRFTPMSLHLYRKKLSVWLVRPFLRAIPISRSGMLSGPSFRTKTLPPYSRWGGNRACRR